MARWLKVFMRFVAFSTSVLGSYFNVSAQECSPKHCHSQGYDLTSRMQCINVQQAECAPPIPEPGPDPLCIGIEVQFPLGVEVVQSKNGAGMGSAFTNPLNDELKLSEQACRASVQSEEVRANIKKISNLAARREILTHMNGIARDYYAKEGSLTYSEVMAHVVECKEFCLPLYSGLAACHMWSVSKSKIKELITFEYDSRNYKAEFGPVIESMARWWRRNQDLDPRIALVARASTPGGQCYNDTLALERASTVSYKLTEENVDGSKIHIVRIGEMHPQINEPLAKEYGLIQELSALGENGINQSVLAVGYYGK